MVGLLLCLPAIVLKVFVLLCSKVPEKPNSTDIDRKIIILGDDQHVSSSQYPLHFDPTLFSDENGNILKYQVYVRQGKS